MKPARREYHTFAPPTGHSKDRHDDTAVQALFVAWYNFSLKHEALKNHTPATASNLTDHVWTIKELSEGGGADAGLQAAKVIMAIAGVVLIISGIVQRNFRDIAGGLCVAMLFVFAYRAQK